nr:secreted RxLR effector protein 161-like [Nicotiana tomentosiformis]
MDVKTVFLNDVQEEEVYIKQREGFSFSIGEHLVCKLKKSIYGLKQASRQWYLKVPDVISSFDFVEKIMDQSPIVKGDKFNLNQCPKNDFEGEQMKNIPYAYVVRRLMYARVCTRPDIAFVVGMLGRYQNNPTIDHLRVAKKVLRYLQGTKDYMLMYNRLDNFEVIVYSDSIFVGCIDSRKSTSRYIFMLAGGAISWKSAKTTLTATSSMEAEFVSYFEATSHGV